MVNAAPSHLSIAYKYFAVKAALIVSGIWIGIVTGCEHWLLLSILGAVI